MYFRSRLWYSDNQDVIAGSCMLSRSSCSFAYACSLSPDACSTMRAMCVCSACGRDLFRIELHHCTYVSSNGLPSVCIISCVGAITFHPERSSSNSSCTSILARAADYTLTNGRAGEL